MKKNTAVPLTSTNNFSGETSYRLEKGRVIQTYLGQDVQSVTLNQLSKLSTANRSASVRVYQLGYGRSYVNFTAQIIGRNLHVGCVVFDPSSSRRILTAAGVYKTRKSSRKPQARAAVAR